MIRRAGLLKPLLGSINVAQAKACLGELAGDDATVVGGAEAQLLGSLKLQAGVGTPDELTTDLRAAREIRREVEALLDGERQVEAMLQST